MDSRFRAFPGFPAPSQAEHHKLSPRGALRIALALGDLLSVSGDAATLAVIAFDARGRSALGALGLTGTRPVSGLPFDDQAYLAWVQAKGGTTDDQRAALIEVDGRIILKAGAECSVWVVLPTPPAQAITGDTMATLSVSVSRAAHTVRLPEPLGQVADAFTVPRGTARAYSLARGDIVQIIDVEGQQCSDFMAFRTDSLDCGRVAMIDSTATRSMVRQPYPQPGLLDKFFDADARPMLQVVQDTCGRHDTYGLACTARGYADRGFPGHLNCSDNISDAMDPYGIARRPAWPAINFFWNTWVDPRSGHILTEESHSRPGDYVAMRALCDLVCVSTACPDDIDPINGWNPTDVHVRIYKRNAPIPRAVAYRAKEDAPMTLSRESAFHRRTAALTQDMAPARDLWLPNTYPSTGTLGEYWACRERVTVQDMSSLRKYDIVGPDAETVLQQVLTRDLSRLAQWRGTYALICDDTGAVVDDGTLFRLGPQVFRWCCGSEESARRIEAHVAQTGQQARLTDMSDTLANLALQGPKSRDVLAQVVFTQPHVPALEQLNWFGVTIARLGDRDGAPFMLSRTGYTGELGYEVFCAQSDAVTIWDALMEAGQAHGVTPMGGAALDIIRTEAGFAAPGAEFAPGVDAMEAGLGFAVDFRKASFVGKAALERNAAAPRRVLTGLMFGGDDVPHHGAPVFAGERHVGQVTSATRSPMLGHGIAMARLAIEFSETGAALEVGMMDGRMKRLPAVVATVPFVDPKRERARA
ncbi:DUF1989 domain-containing protein [uncultured Tateyamaria sp.]|uniref:DUF1989 domain-containing protein n=1 Tax=Tateyamaria sp. 1078 TaxID=3417464 RepID=UPI0026026E5C|nr:DUF1989 domain-containing protein [uncultured Tateyamaria sp.]